MRGPFAYLHWKQCTLPSLPVTEFWVCLIANGGWACPKRHFMVRALPVQDEAATRRAEKPRHSAPGAAPGFRHPRRHSSCKPEQEPAQQHQGHHKQDSGPCQSHGSTANLSASRTTQHFRRHQSVTELAVFQGQHACKTENKVWPPLIMSGVSPVLLAPVTSQGLRLRSFEHGEDRL